MFRIVGASLITRIAQRHAVTTTIVTGVRGPAVRHSKTSPFASLAFIFLGLAVVADPLGAQATEDSSLVAVGDRVRASTANGTFIGRVTRQDVKGIELMAEGTHLSLGYRDLDGLEVSDGARSRLMAGVALGGALGGIAGVAVSVVHGLRDLNFFGGCTGRCFWKEEVLPAVKIGGVAGGVVGGVIGALIKEEAWKPVPLGEYVDGFSPIVAVRRDPEGRLLVSIAGRLRF